MPNEVHPPRRRIRLVDGVREIALENHPFVPQYCPKKPNLKACGPDCPLYEEYQDPVTHRLVTTSGCTGRTYVYELGDFEGF